MTPEGRADGQICLSRHKLQALKGIRADRLGVSHTFVQKVRAELVKVGKIEAPKTVSTKDGREYPAELGASATVADAQPTPPENPGIFDGVDEQSGSAEPVNKSDDGRCQRLTPEGPRSTCNGYKSRPWAEH